MNKTEIKRGIGKKVYVYRQSATFPMDGVYVIVRWDDVLHKAVVEHENSKRYPGSVFIDSKYVHRLEVK